MTAKARQRGGEERGTFYEIELPVSGDVGQAHLVGAGAQELRWRDGFVGWHKTADVTATFTNAGADAMAVSGGNGVLLGWVSHPNDADTQAAETVPITGLRFTASAADQKVILYTGGQLKYPPVDAGTPA